MKSDEMPYIVYSELEYLKKKSMDVQAIQKNL